MIEVNCRLVCINMNAVKRKVNAVVRSAIKQRLEEWRFGGRRFLGHHQHIDFEAGFLGADFKNLSVGVGGLVRDDDIGKQSQQGPKDDEAEGDHSERVAAEPFPGQGPWGLLFRLAFHGSFVCAVKNTEFTLVFKPKMKKSKNLPQNCHCFGKK